MATFIADSRALARISRRFDVASKDIYKELQETGERASEAMLAAMAEQAPESSGQLKDELYATVAMRAHGFDLAAGSAVSYDRYVREGRGAGKPMPPREPIEAWMVRAGIDLRLSYVVRRAIGLRGIPPNDYVGRALEDVRDDIRQDVRGLPRRVIERAKGASESGV